MALSDEFRINELKKGGSSAIKSKDDRGVHTYYSYVETDGESAGNIELPKYNDIELKKAVDLIVDELIPQSAEDALLTVKKKVYDDLLAQLLAERARVVELNEEIGRLNVDISELQSLIDLLRSEVDIAKLSEAALQTEFLSLNEKYTTLIEDFQSALTKGILESIERASLYAQVVGLQKQVDSLSKQLFGKLSKIQEGAKVSTQFSVKVLRRARIDLSDIIFQAKSRDRGEIKGNTTNFINGPEIELFNFTDKPITIKVTEIDNTFLDPIPNITLAPDEIKIITLKHDKDIVDKLVPKFIRPTLVNIVTGVLTGTIGLQFIAKGIFALSTGDRKYIGKLEFSTDSSSVSLSKELHKYQSQNDFLKQ